MKLFFVTLFVITNLLSFESYNSVNKNYKITSKKDLQEKYATKISPLFYANKLHFFKSFDSAQIAYKIFRVKNAKANIVISSGRTEGMIKYQEFIYDLNRNGYSVYILDHRGQGYSQRFLEDTQIGYVKFFDDYVEDMHIFVSKFVPKDKKLILIGHSMGGAIASLYVEKYSYDFDALVLSSPMLEPNLVGTSLTKLACEIIEKRKRNIDRYILGESSYDDSDKKFEENILTHSKVRFEITKNAFEKEPRTKIGGPSVRWIKEACKGSKRSVDEAHKVKIPTLLLQAGSDTVVNPKPQELFCKRVEACQGYRIDNAYHELFVEQDSIRAKTLTALLSFISKI